MIALTMKHYFNKNQGTTKIILFSTLNIFLMYHVTCAYLPTSETLKEGDLPSDMTAEGEILHKWDFQVKNMTCLSIYLQNPKHTLFLQSWLYPIQGVLLLLGLFPFSIPLSVHVTELSSLNWTFDISS